MVVLDRFQKILDVGGPSIVGINVMHTNFGTVESVLKFLREAQLRVGDAYVFWLA